MELRTNWKIFRSREEWEEIRKKFEGRGLRAEEFCRREGIGATVFRKWRKLLVDVYTKQATKKRGNPK